MASDADLFGEALKRSATPAFTPAPSAAAPSGVPAAGAPTPTAGAGGTPLGRFLEGQIAEYTRLGQEGPVSRFFGGNARMDAIRQAVPGLAQSVIHEQTLQESTRQFITNKQIAAGTLFTGFLEKVASAKPEARALVLDMGREFFAPLMKTLGFDLPPNLLKTMATTPGTASRFASFIGDVMGQDPDAIRQVSGEIAGLSDEQVAPYIKSRFDSTVTAALPQVQQTITTWARAVRSNPGLMSRLGLLDQAGQAQAIPGDLVMAQVPQLFTTNAQRAAAYKVLSDKDYAGYLANVGVTPGTVSEEQAKIIGISMAKGATPEGQAALRKTQAETAHTEAQTGQIPVKTAQIQAETTKAQAETGMVPYKTIPGAGGAIVKVGPAGTTPAGEVAATGTTGEATAGPGAEIVARTPGPGLTPEATKEIVRGEKVEAALTRASQVRNDPTIQKYVGPKTTRPLGAFIEWFQKSSPGGQVPKNYTVLQQASAELRNYLIPEITGAAVRADEEPRIMAEAPDLDRDKWGPYWQKFDQTLATIKVINQRKKELYAPDGRLRTGVDAEAVAKKYPLPKALSTGPSAGATTDVHFVRDSTGRLVPQR